MDSSVLAALGWLAMPGDWDWRRAYDYFVAARREGDSGVGLAWYYALVEGRFEDARRTIDEALRVAPDQPDWLLAKGAIASAAGEWDIAVSQFEAVPRDAFAWGDLVDFAGALRGAGRLSEAESIARQAVERSGGVPSALVQLLEILVMSDQAEAVLRTGSKIREAIDAGTVPQAWRARAYLAMGQADEALDAMELDFEAGSGFGLFELRRFAYLQAFGGNRRYWGLVERMGFPALPVYHEFYELEQALRFNKSVD